MSARALRVGDLVSAGNARDNDYDTGKVVEVLATGEVYVRWRVARATYLEQPEVLTLHLTRLSRAGEARVLARENERNERAARDTPPGAVWYGAGACPNCGAMPETAHAPSCETRRIIVEAIASTRLRRAATCFIDCERERFSGRCTTPGPRTEAQDDGRACVRCGAVGSAMVPTGARGSRGAQLFECVPVDVSLLLGK